MRSNKYQNSIVVRIENGADFTESSAPAPAGDRIANIEIGASDSGPQPEACWLEVAFRGLLKFDLLGLLALRSQFATD